MAPDRRQEKAIWNNHLKLKAIETVAKKNHRFVADSTRLAIMLPQIILFAVRSALSSARMYMHINPLATLCIKHHTLSSNIDVAYILWWTV